MKHTHQALIASISIGMLLLAAASCSKPGQNAPSPAAASETVFAIYTMPAAKGQLTNYLRVNGDVKNTVNVDVLPDTAGKLVSLKVSLGQYVSKGEVIAEVDPSRPGMEFVVSPVRSPIEGTVTALPFSVGATVALSTPIARLGRLGDVTITTSVSERFLSSMRIGLLAIIQLEAYPGDSFEGRVSEIAPVVDPMSRSLEIKIKALKPDSRLRPGMFAQIKLMTENKTGIVKVPSEAIVRRFGESFVFIANADRAEKRPVVIGLDVDGQSEIREGLSAGELVVVRGQTILEDQSRIKVVKELPALPAVNKAE